MIRIILTYSILVLCFLTIGMDRCFGQVDTLKTQQDSLFVTPDTLTADTLGADTMAVDTTRSDTLRRQQPQKPSIRIIPWKYNHGLGAKMATSDSLMRWQNWPDWTFKKNRDPGVLSFRLGTVGRSSSLMINAHEPRHQSLFWEDIPMHDRVSGTVNWSVLPIHKIETMYEEGTGITHETTFTLKNYYVNKPLSKLLFDESKFNRRALEFWVTQNFSQKTNAEISYWDRRAGGGYPNSSFNGSQIFARVYHQMNNEQFFKLRFLNGSRNLGEPFGYQIADLRLFPFNHFNAVANQSNASSESSLNTLALSYHQRPPDTTAVTENLRAGLFMNNQKRQVSYSADTTFFKVSTIGGYAHKWLEWDPFRVEGVLRYELLSNKEQGRSSVGIDNWSQLTATGKAQFNPLAWITLRGDATFKNRSDGFRSYTLGADAELQLGKRLQLSGGGSRGTVLPTIQQLYWDSNEYAGSSELQNELIQEVHGSASYQILDGLKAGVKGQYKQIYDGVMLNDQNNFVNIWDYDAASATVFADFENRHFELSGSGTAQQYMNAAGNQTLGVPGFNTTRVWLKGGAYWKGYLFDRATYIKAGLSGMLSPLPYKAEHYNTALDYWQPASTDQQLPWYSRLDVDISARVRSIMFVLRYENVLDQVSQLGYFETAGYPMPSRRFLFGVRTLFNN